MLTRPLFPAFQEEQNKGKPNWEHLNEELHVLITVEDTRNRSELKIIKAVEEVKKLLVPSVRLPFALIACRKFLTYFRRIFWSIWPLGPFWAAFCYTLGVSSPRQM